ncbi:MAG: tetratricopeptide repeat protein [Myxococcaceae bacterium]|nr:tetratricopeptide repeat protein [Myxococcaceae bacterium]MCA3011743.1 tetratricopeptide repeat protein [Myxococcaceae bacterium]
MNELEVRLKAGDAAGVMALAASRLAAAPDDVEALVALASLNAVQGHVDRARVLLSRVPDAQRARYDVRLLQGALFEAQGQLAQAELTYRSLVREEPTRAGAFGALGQLELQRSAPRAAKETLLTAIALDGAVGAYHLALASALGQLGDLEGAERALIRATQLDPSDLRLYPLWAEVLVATGRGEQARAMLDAVLAQVPGEPTLTALRASLPG